MIGAIFGFGGVPCAIETFQATSADPWVQEMDSLRRLGTMTVETEWLVTADIGELQGDAVGLGPWAF